MKWKHFFMVLVVLSIVVPGYYAVKQHYRSMKEEIQTVTRQSKLLMSAEVEGVKNDYASFYIEDFCKYDSPDGDLRVTYRKDRENAYILYVNDVVVGYYIQPMYALH